MSKTAAQRLVDATRATLSHDQYDRLRSTLDVILRETYEQARADFEREVLRNPGAVPVEKVEEIQAASGLNPKTILGCWDQDKRWEDRNWTKA